MTLATLVNTCQACGAEESLDALLLRMIDDDQVRRLIADVLTASLPLGGLVVRYLRLHKPPKQRLRMDKVAKLLEELVPDIQRTAIQRNGRMWAVNGDSWKAALQAVFDARAKGTLSLPLEGNGYLYATLMRMADRTEAAQEREIEAGRKHGIGSATVAARGPAASLGAVLDQTFADRDPELVKRDHQARRSTGAPDFVRKQLAELQGKATATPAPLPTKKGTPSE